MRQKKTIISLAILFCFLLLLVGSYCFLASERGTTIILNTIEKRMGGNFSYGHLSGAILGHLDLQKIKIHTPNGDIKINHLQMTSSFNPLKRKLITEELKIENLELTPRLLRLSNGSSGKFYFPLQVDIKKIYLLNAKIKTKKQAINLPDVVANFSYLSHDLNLTAHLIGDKSKFINLSHNRADTHVDLKLPIKKTQWQMHYAATNSDFVLNGQVTDSQGGSIHLQGEGLASNISIHALADRIHVNDLLPNYWPSAINFDLQVRHQDTISHVELKNLTGSIDNTPIRGKGNLVLDNHQIKTVDLRITSNDNKIVIEQKAPNTQDLNWAIDITNLQHFLPKSKGGLNANGSIQNINTMPIITGRFKGEGIIISTNSLRKLDGSFLLNLKSQQTDSYLRFNANDLSFSRVHFVNVNAEAKGSLNRHEISLQAKTKEQSANTHILGQYINTEWRGNIDSLSITNQKQKWHLKQPLRARVNKKRIAIEPLFLIADKSMITLKGRYLFNQGIRGVLHIKNFDLSFLNLFLPEDIKIQGSLDIIADADLVKKKRLKLDATIKPGLLSYSSNKEVQKMAIRGGKLHAVAEKNILKATTNLDFGDGSLNANFTSPHLDFAKNLNQQELKGQINLQLAQAKFFELLIPPIKNVNGTLKGHYEVSGSLTKPILQGNLELVRGSFKIPKLGLQVTNVNINAHSDRKEIRYQGSLSSGNGILHITGFTNLAADGFPTNLNLQGSNILICNQPDIKIFASPTMNLGLTNNELKLSGKLLIPEANLHPRDFGTTQTVSDDIIFVQANGEQVENTNLKIISSIQLILGNKIFLNSHGIKGQVLGQLRIEDDPSKATVAYGQLWLQDGNYKIYGKILDIDAGKLIFTGGPISNPGLDIKASRTLQARSNSLLDAGENIKVGVSVTGTLHDPKIKLFSEPAGKSQEDILSYLIVGMPVNSINKSVGQSNTQLLLQAADALNLSGDNKLLNFKDKLKQRLGLTEFDIGTQSEIDPSTQETTQHTAFVLGKYLSPKFYINYSLDLFDHTNTLRVRYLLNKFWTVQSVANPNGSGVDILYTVERK